MSLGNRTTKMSLKTEAPKILLENKITIWSNRH